MTDVSSGRKYSYLCTYQWLSPLIPGCTWLCVRFSSTYLFRAHETLGDYTGLEISVNSFSFSVYFRRIFGEDDTLFTINQTNS